MRLSQSESESTSKPATESRIVVGIDGAPAGLAALDVARSLCIPAPHYILVYAVESVMPDGSFPPATFDPSLARMVRESEDAGWRALNEADAAIGGPAASSDRRLVHGDPALELSRLAKHEKADLVVVGHNRRTGLDDVLLGSAARKLVYECPNDVLVVRKKSWDAKTRVAVFATDDSPEAAGCLERFIRLAPRGLSKVYVLTVNEVEVGRAAMLVNGLPHLKDKAEHWVERGMRDDAEAQCARLRAEGFDAVPLVVKGTDVSATISRACDEVGASLVVVAAPPHGFWDRLLNGSVTNELLANDKRSLLVMRP